MLSAQLHASMGLYRLHRAAWVPVSRHCCQARNEASVPQFSETTRHKSTRLAKPTMDALQTCPTTQPPAAAFFHEIGMAGRNYHIRELSFHLTAVGCRNLFGQSTLATEVCDLTGPKRAGSKNCSIRRHLMFRSFKIPTKLRSTV